MDREGIAKALWRYDYVMAFGTEPTDQMWEQYSPGGQPVYLERADAVIAYLKGEK